MKYMLLLAVSTLWGCDTFATPAELESAQILAVKSEPASVGLGESATLRLLAADADGPLANPDIEWTLQEQPGFPVVGKLERKGDEMSFVAPAELPSFPTAVAVEARIENGEAPLVADKIMLIGGPRLANPSISKLSFNDHTVDDLILLRKGETVELDVELDPAPSDDVSYAWYARPGTIEAYRSTPTTLIASEEAADGWLYIVVRDRGGIDYRAVRLRVR